MRVILYPRVSTKKQLKGESIDAQERRLKSFCKEKGYDIIDIWTDAGKSASLKEDKMSLRVRNDFMFAEFDLKQRPAFKKILEHAGSGDFDAVVFYRWDRAFRSVVFAKLSQLYLKNKGIELIPSDDSNEPLTSSIMQILSEEEIRKMKERVRSSRLERFERSVMVGRSPFGYRFNKKKKVMEIDKRKADIVKKIFSMKLSGKDYREICKETKLKPQQVYNILKNKAYCGYIVFEGIEKKGVHDALISEGDWERVNHGAS